VGALSPLFINVALNVPLQVAPALALAALKKRIAMRELRGKVDQHRIRLRPRGVFPHRPFQPAFEGFLDTSDNPIQLRGTIRTPGLLRLFIWWWLGFCIFWTLGALVATQLDGALRWMPLGGLLMLALGYCFFSFVNQFVAGLARTLETAIR
jgi:hypothetical protein